MMEATTICPNNFFLGEMGKISSLTPIKKISNKPQIIYCKSPNKLKGVHKTIEKIIPAKIPTPPKEGVISL